jgi:hypothetical protein
VEERARRWWLLPVILPTQVASGGSRFKASLGKLFYLKKTHHQKKIIIIM